MAEGAINHRAPSAAEFNTQNIGDFGAAAAELHQRVNELLAGSAEAHILCLRGLAADPEIQLPQTEAEAAAVLVRLWSLPQANPDNGEKDFWPDAHKCIVYLENAGQIRAGQLPPVYPHVDELEQAAVNTLLTIANGNEAAMIVKMRQSLMLILGNNV